MFPTKVVKKIKKTYFIFNNHCFENRKLIR